MKIVLKTYIITIVVHKKSLYVQGIYKECSDMKHHMHKSFVKFLQRQECEQCLETFSKGPDVVFLKVYPAENYIIDPKVRHLKYVQCSLCSSIYFRFLTETELHYVGFESESKFYQVVTSNIDLLY